VVNLVYFWSLDVATVGWHDNIQSMRSAAPLSVIPNTATQVDMPTFQFLNLVDPKCYVGQTCLAVLIYCHSQHRRPVVNANIRQTCFFSREIHKNPGELTGIKTPIV